MHKDLFSKKVPFTKRHSESPISNLEYHLDYNLVGFNSSNLKNSLRSRWCPPASRSVSHKEMTGEALKQKPGLPNILNALRSGSFQLGVTRRWRLGSTACRLNFFRAKSS